MNNRPARAMMKAVVNGVASLGVLLGWCPASSADVFYVDPVLSSISLSGSFTLAGVGGIWSVSSPIATVNGTFSVTGSGDVVQQGIGSLDTALTGTIDATSSPSTLTVDSSAISAAINGTWKPGTSNEPTQSAPAQLAGQTTPVLTFDFGDGLAGAVLGFLADFFGPTLEQTVFGAARWMVLDLSGAPTLSAGTFPVNDLAATFSDGSINVGGFAGGTVDLTNFSFAAFGTGAGSFVDGPEDVLQIPFDILLAPGFSLIGVAASGTSGPLTGNALITAGTLDASLQLRGLVYASTAQPSASVPEPLSLALVAVGLLALGVTTMRGRVRRARS